MREPVIVLRDAVDDYAARYVRAAYERFGWRSVLVTTDPVQRALAAGTLPVLTSDAVAARLRCPAGRASDLATTLAARFEVRAVVPQGEPQVIDSAVLADRLGVAWVEPDVARRFRDKAALKDHLRKTTGVRVNAAGVVTHVGEVRAELARGGYDRYVLKPNDGTGNSRIAFLSSGTSDAEVAALLAGGPMLMEEFLDGPEYCVNGQVDAAGAAMTYSVQRTVHTERNGRPQLATAFQFLRRSSPEFQDVASYAERVLAASGLRNSPFHMEVIVDQQGPCMVECAARLVGAGLAPLTSRLHGGSFDVFELALEGYSGAPSSRSLVPDWDEHDARSARVVCGVHERTEVVARVDGIAAVESMTQFDDWIVRPRPGQRVHATTSLFEAPWIVGLVGADAAQLERVEDAVRGCVRINPEGGLLPRPVTQARAVGSRVVRQLRAVPELVSQRPETAPLDAAGNVVPKRPSKIRGILEGLVRH